MSLIYIGVSLIYIGVSLLYIDVSPGREYCEILPNNTKLSKITSALSFTSTLLVWYAEHGRHDLLWRRTTDPYRIWISEIILQQTRVSQGQQYYERFVERFPTVAALARASEDEVLRLWQGLGYYSRARNLHAAAKQIMESGGEFPTNYADVRALKGVGPYTAAAICAFAYGQPYAVVDGNVYRVLARYFGIATPIDGTVGKKEFAQLADSLLARTAPADYNSAIMDFGALQCTPTSPLCEQCPLCDSCQAYQQGLVNDLPVKAKRTAVSERHFLYLLIHDGERLLLERRPAGDIWQGLYQPLLIEYQAPTTEQAMLADIHKMLRDTTGTTIQTPAFRFRHILTHRILHLTCYAVHCPTLPNIGSLQPVPFSQLDEYAMPRAILTALEQLGLDR